MLLIDEATLRNAVRTVLSRKFYAEGATHVSIGEALDDIAEECKKYSTHSVGPMVGGCEGKNRTIAVDFDGVIHRYSEGWRDGTIYDPPKEGAIDSVLRLMDKGFSVFIHTTRNPGQIVRWLQSSKRCGHSDFDESVCAMSPYSVRRVYPWERFWNKTNVLGVTKRKLPAMLYIDDRGWQFSKWSDPELWDAVRRLCR